jgi:hypothetical protein
MLAIALLLARPGGPAWAQGDAVCTAPDAAGLRAALAGTALADWRRPALLYAYSRLPIEGTAQIAVSGQPMPRAGGAGAGEPGFTTLRVLVIQSGGADDGGQGGGGAGAALAGGLDVTPLPAPSDNPLVAAKRIAADDLLINFAVPSPYGSAADGPWPWQSVKLVAIACDKSGKVVFVSAPREITVSGRWLSIGFALIPAAIIYLLVAGASVSFDRGKKASVARPSRGKRGFFRALDPVCMTSGPDGKGSLARLQILFFTILIACILSFLLFRIGYLSDMSSTVLALLGISAVGAAASKATDGTQLRLEAENWAWLTSRYWLPENGLGPYTTPRWRDLVTSEDGFDVYHFQMLVFSLVVGVALLQAGCTDIASFKIPDTLLGVLGLSQAAYVGGKLVSPPAYGDLDKLLTEIRTMEDNYVKLCIDERTAPDAAALAVAASGKGAAEEVYKIQMRKVIAYFPTVFGNLARTSGYTGHAPNTAPPVVQTNTP